MADGSPPELRLTVDASGPVQLDWVGLASDGSGFGDEARGFVRSLAPLLPGMRLLDLPCPKPVGDLRPEHRAAIERAAHRRVDTGQPPVCVLHLPSAAACQRMPGAAYQVARSMFEADRLPPAWVQQANRVDEIWVPSTFNVESFRASGVTTRIEVVPGGVDTDVFHPGVPAMHLPGARSTTFLSIFEWHVRKAPETLLRAWAAAFGPDDDVCLVLRTGLTAQSLEEAIQALTGRPAECLAPVLLLPERITDADLPALYGAADVVVLPTRGEGWSRTVSEAMACARTVITTRWSAHLDFIDDDSGLLIDIDGLVPVEAPDLPCAGLRWAQPSEDHLVELLRRGTRPEERARIGAAARARIEPLSWDAAARQVVAHSERIWADLGTRRVRRAPAGPRVRWQGDQFRHTSLAKINQVTCLGLLDRRWDVHVASREIPEISPHGDEGLRPLVEATSRRGPADVEVHFEWPPRFERSGPHPLVLFQPWEFGALPAEWVRRAAEVDEFWVPSRWVRDCFVMAGIPTDRVVVMPHGVDTSRYRPDGPRFPLRSGKGTNLLFVGGLVWRKGFDLLLDAYLKTFTASDDVCLVVKATDFYRDAYSEQMRRVIRMAQEGGLAAIEVIDDDLSEPAMAALYRTCDALVHPYRGEGFAMPVLEAMASGLPVAVTAHGATMDFADSTCAALVRARLVNFGGTEMDGIPLTAPPFVAESDLDALAATLRSLVSDTVGNRRRADVALHRVQAGWTVDQSVDRIAARLHTLASRARQAQHRPDRALT